MLGKTNYHSDSSISCILVRIGNLGPSPSRREQITLGAMEEATNAKRGSFFKHAHLVTMNISSSLVCIGVLVILIGVLINPHYFNGILIISFTIIYILAGISGGFSVKFHKMYLDCENEAIDQPIFFTRKELLPSARKGILLSLIVGGFFYGAAISAAISAVKI